MRVIVILAAMLAVAACSSGGQVIVGEQRPAIHPNEVQVYTSTNPPEQYEEIAILTNEDAGGWVQTQQNKTNRLITKLKAQAAELGANGIILTNISNRTETSHDIITTTSHLTEGEAMAIWVPPAED